MGEGGCRGALFNGAISVIVTTIVVIITINNINNGGQRRGRTEGAGEDLIDVPLEDLQALACHSRAVVTVSQRQLYERPPAVTE